MKLVKRKIIFSNYDDIHNPYYGGGGAIAIHEIARRLVDKFDVTVITGRYSGSKNGIIDGVIYKRIGLSWLGPRLGQFVYFIILPFYVLTGTFDIWIESFTPPFSTGFLPWFTRKPVIGLVHMLAGEDMERKYKFPFHIVENFGIKQYSQFIVLSSYIKQKIEKLNPNAFIEMIGNGIDRPNLSATQPKKYISYIGRIEVNQKGLDLLLKAYKSIAGNTNVRLAIAGSGTDSEIAKLKSIISQLNLTDRIDLYGKVCGKEKKEFFEKSLLNVIPSRFETFSLVALEALSFELPLVVFDIEGLNWLPSSCCIKVKSFDYEAMGQAMFRLLEDRELGKHLITESKKIVENYTWACVFNKYSKFISKTLIWNHHI